MSPRSRTCLLAVALTVSLAAAGCGSSSSTTTTTHAPVKPAPVILAAPPQPTSFAQVTTGLHNLYAARPAVATYVTRNVEYSPKTRDKVLRVCREGGPEKTARARESARVLACAPLIYFYYAYGRSASAPDAITFAQRLYWYAVVHNTKPVPAAPQLTALLIHWGVH